MDQDLVEKIKEQYRKSIGRVVGRNTELANILCTKLTDILRQTEIPRWREDTEPSGRILKMTLAGFRTATYKFLSQGEKCKLSSYFNSAYARVKTPADCDRDAASMRDLLSIDPMELTREHGNGFVTANTAEFVKEFFQSRYRITVGKIR